jgi:hypothetical protein
LLIVAVFAPEWQRLGARNDGPSYSSITHRSGKACLHDARPVRSRERLNCIR